MSRIVRFVVLLTCWVGPLLVKTAQAQPIEICTNGIDDDGDRLVDCQDPDCPECARFINCVEPNTCYMPPIWAVPVSPTALSNSSDNVYGAQDLVLSTNAEFTTVTIRTPDGSYTRTVVVTATGSTIVQLPLSVVMSNSPNTIQRNKGLIITSDEPVQATYRQTPGLNQDIVPLKCRAALGYSFYAGSQTRLTATNVPNERHFVSVMATQPNTVVTFRSPIAFDGVSTFPLSVTLQDNETYMLASRLVNSGANSANESVSGVLITSNQPIVVNSGSQHTSQPYSGNRDAGMDQLVPIRTTGTNYVAMHSQNTTANADYVIVIATENNTSVSIAGPSAVGGTAGVLSTTTLSAGQVFTYNLPNVPNRAYSITASKRAYVYHVSSYAANEFGMGILPTINPCNGSKRIDFYRTTGSSNDQAVVTIPTAGLASLTFRGAAYATYGTVVDIITIAGVAHSIVSFPNTSIAPAGTVNTLTSNERFHVGVVSNTGGASTGNFGFYSNYEAKVDVLNPITKQPDDFYTVAEVVKGVATPHCLTLTSCGTNDQITGIVNGTFTQATSFTGACLTYTMLTSAPKCARDTIRVQVENNIGRQGIICLEFVNIDNNLISRIIPENPVVCQPTGSASLTIIAEQIEPLSGITYKYQTITPDKQLYSTSIVSSTATGLYRISVTDSNGCRDTTTVNTRPETATIAFGSGPVTVCAGATATYTVNSITGAYGWTVTGGTILAGGTPTSNSVTVRWTSTGSVRASVTSSNSCTALATRAVTILPNPALSSTGQNPLCNGSATGIVDLSVTSGSAPYTYRWGSGATTEDVSGLAAGVYSVTVTDKFGCTPSAGPLSVTLTNATALSLTTARTNVLCNGASTGTASTTGLGGIAPYRYQWSNGATTQVVSGLLAGSYTVTVQDANNCTLSQVVSITQPPPLSPALMRTNVACNAGNTGSLTLSVSGGTPGYTFRWNDGSTNQNRAGLPAGAYSVTITDANNCTATTTTQLTEPSALTLAATTTSVRCNGAAEGTIDLSVSGGTPGYAYRWNTGATTEDLNGLGAGVYSVTVTDANACTRTLVATVAQPTALSLTFRVQNPTCDGGSDGAITASLSGGTPPQNVRWSDGGTGPNRAGLLAGPYSVTATDAKGCAVMASTNLVAPAAVTATGTVTDMSCSDGNTGQVSVTTSGGTGSYTYVWNTGATSPTINNLPAGEYSVTIRDASNCRFDYGASVRQPRPLSVTVLSTDAPCFGGMGNITTEVRGGTEPYRYQWSNRDGGPGATSPTVYSLIAGTYTLVVTDANGCTATTSTTINQPPNFAINAIVVPVACNGAADASINTTVEGGTAPYRYRWHTGATTEDLSNLPAGVYSLTVTDANDCTETVAINVQEPPLMMLTSTQTDVSCFASKTGVIDLIVTGGTRPYTFQWADNATTEDRLNLSAGGYLVVVTDRNSCTVTRAMTISQPTALTILPSITAVACNGGTNGAVALSVSGGVTPYQFAWSTGQTSASLTNLASNFYSATVTNANGCTVDLVHQVTQPTALTIRATQRDVGCNGGNNGQITVTVSGGTPGYRFQWADDSRSADAGQPGPTTANRTGLMAGTYSLTVLDANNCAEVRSFTISQPTALSLATTIQPVICAGGSSGAIALSPGGGVGPYDVRWNDEHTAVNRMGLVAGTYSMTIADANKCVLSRTFSIAQPMPLAASGSSRDVSCAGGSDGTISLAVSGGTTDYSFAWSGDVLNPSAQHQTSLSAGVYFVQIRDENGCQTSRSFSLTQPEPLRVTARATPVRCNGGSDGAVSLEVSGGTTPYQYRWSSGQTAPAISGLPAGVYSATVTDSQGCSAVVSVLVSEPSRITLSANTTAASCNGGSDGRIDLTSSGGITPYQFQWRNASGTIIATTEDLTDVRAGIYVASVTDLNNCLASLTVIIGQASALSLSLTPQHNRCEGDISGAVNLNVSGGVPSGTGNPYTYRWSNGFPDRNIGDLTMGNYSVVVTDANGCTATGSTSLTAPPRLSALYSTTDASCFRGTNGAIDVSVSGGVGPYSYTWVDGYDTPGPGTQNRAGLGANTYTITVRDANSCRTDVVITVNEPTALRLTGLATEPACNGASTGAVSVTATGGTQPYQYRWSTGATTSALQNLTAGIYSITLTDANRCTEALALTLSQPSALSLSSNVQNVSCDGGSDGSARVSVSGGVAPYTYQWTTPNGGTAISTSAISGLPKDNYIVTVTDANGCTLAASMAITQPLPLTASVLGTDVLCNGQFTGQITTEVREGTAPYTYLWSNHDGGPGSTNATVNGLPASSIPYSLTVTDANGCTATTSASVNQPQPFNLNAVVVAVSCEGGANGSIDLTVEGATPPYRYRWSNPDGGPEATTEDVSGLVAGIYSVTVLDANDCVESTTINVGQPGSLSVNLNASALACFQDLTGQVSLTVTGGRGPYTYVWTDKGTPSTASTPDRTNLEAGPYSVTVLDANGCSIVKSVTLSQPPALALTGSATAVSRNGEATGALNVSVAGGTPGYTYQWNTGTTTASPQNLTAGVYSVTVTDANGCFDVRSLTVHQPTAMSITSIPVNIACNGASTGRIDIGTLGGVGPYTYSWSNDGATSPASTSARTGLAAGTYSVTVTDANGAMQATTVVISQPPALTLTPTIQNVLCYDGNNGLIALDVSGGTPTTAGSGTTASGGGYSYHWNAESSPLSATTSYISNLTAGLYSVTVSDVNGCTALQRLTVAQPSALSLADSSTSVAINGQSTGTISLTASGGTSFSVGELYRYVWTDPNSGSAAELPNRYNLPAGTYSVTVTDANGCAVSTTLVIREPTALTLSAQVQTVSCKGGSNGAVSLSVTGGVEPYTYQWMNSDSQPVSTTQNLTGLLAGNYKVLVTDANGATAITGVAIAQPEPLTASVITTDVLCNGQATGQITTEVRGGTPSYTYLWSNPNGGPGSTSATVNGLPASPTPYTLIVTDANGCTATTSATINQPQPFNLNAVVRPVACRGGATGSIDLTAEGSTAPHRYQWSTGATTEDVDALTAGTYSVTVTDGNNCVESTSMVVQEPLALTVSLTHQNPTCREGSTGMISLTTLGGTEPYRYAWTDGGSLVAANTAERTDLIAGVYSITVTDANGCFEVRSVTLADGTRPSAQLIAVPSTMAGPISRNDGQLVLGEFIGTLQYDISLGGVYSGSATSSGSLPIAPSDGVLTRSLLNPTDPQQYTVRLFDSSGCFIDLTTLLQSTVFNCSPDPACVPVAIRKLR